VLFFSSFAFPFLSAIERFPATPCKALLRRERDGNAAGRSFPVHANGMRRVVVGEAISALRYWLCGLKKLDKEKTIGGKPFVVRRWFFFS
jgi:hypothetical protein